MYFSCVRSALAIVSGSDSVEGANVLELVSDDARDVVVSEVCGGVDGDAGDEADDLAACEKALVVALAVVGPEGAAGSTAPAGHQRHLSLSLLSLLSLLLPSPLS